MPASPSDGAFMLAEAVPGLPRADAIQAGPPPHGIVGKAPPRQLTDEEVRELVTVIASHATAPPAAGLLDYVISGALLGGGLFVVSFLLNGISSPFSSKVAHLILQDDVARNIDWALIFFHAGIVGSVSAALLGLIYLFCTSMLPRERAFRVARVTIGSALGTLVGLLVVFASYCVYQVTNAIDLFGH